MTTVKITQASAFEAFDSASFNRQAYANVYDASISMKGEGNYILVYSNRDGAKSCLIFTPEDRLVEAIKKYYRPHVHAL